MLTNNLIFMQNFDERMHYANYYSLLDLKDHEKEISFNDSVQQKKCSQRYGKWNFIKNGLDHSCGVYHTLELIRQSILLAKEKNKNSVDIAFVSVAEDLDTCVVFNYDQETQYFINMENLKKRKLSPQNPNKECYKCDTTISKKIFFKIVKPALKQLLIKFGYELTELTLKEKNENKCFRSLMNSNRYLDVIRIEFQGNKDFKKSIINSPVIKDDELQLTSV